jgi:hypothetical protein
MKIFLGIALLFSAIVSFAWAMSVETTIFLYPQVRLEKTPVKMGDIASIKEDGFGTINSIEINPVFYKDGIIDLLEIKAILKSNGIRRADVIGSGVALIVCVPEPTAAMDKKPIVKKGDIVKVRIIRGIVIVESSGTAIADAALDELVGVSLKRGKTAQCRVTAEHEVELVL